MMKGGAIVDAAIINAPRFHQERRKGPGFGNAPDEEGKRVAFWLQENGVPAKVIHDLTGVQYLFPGKWME